MCVRACVCGVCALGDIDVDAFKKRKDTGMLRRTLPLKDFNSTTEV